MYTEFKPMTETELEKYSFEATPNFSIIETIVIKYLDFYKKVGIDVDDVIKFVKGSCSNNAMSRDTSTNTTYMNLSESGLEDNITLVVNELMMTSLRGEVENALYRRDNDDSLRYEFEQEQIKHNIKIHKKRKKRERKSARKEAKRRDKFYKKHGYYEEEIAKEKSDVKVIEDNSDILEQEAENAARVAMYSQYEQIPVSKERALEGQITPSKPPLIAVHKNNNMEEHIIPPVTETAKTPERIIYNEHNLKEILGKNKEV